VIAAPTKPPVPQETEAEKHAKLRKQKEEMQMKKQ